jgi:hypothetical protein
MSPAGNKTEVDYKVVDTKDVVLTIAFGEAQLGASTVLGAKASWARSKASPSAMAVSYAARTWTSIPS